LLKHATDFFKDLFDPAMWNLVPISAELWEDNKKVSSSDNNDLVRPFSKGEIKEALDQMEHNKTTYP
jgi:hypothetical protein